MSGALAAALSSAEQAQLQEKLWRFVGTRAARYTAGESSSLPEETVRSLLEGALYVLEAGGCAGRGLLTEDLNAAFARGVPALRAQVVRVKALWQRVCLSVPTAENLALRDTLRSIGAGFARYDILFSAQEFPCSIDYPTALPVPEAPPGIRYISAYLESILLENALLRPFPWETVVRLLEVYCRDWRGLLINLCEPVVTNAVGLALLGGDVLSLNITETDRAALAARFALLPESAGRKALAEGAAAFCHTVGVADTNVLRYAGGIAAGLYPRIRAARLAGIFFSLEP